MSHDQNTIYIEATLESIAEIEAEIEKLSIENIKLRAKLEALEDQKNWY